MTEHSRRIPISLIPTFHHDIAYLKPERVYTPDCFDILDEAMRILQKEPDYHFTLEQAWLLEQYWAARPAQRPLMRQFAQEGRLGVSPGLYAVPDMNLLSGESLYMQARVGKDIVKKTLRLHPRYCLITDSWGHHGQLPQILAQCGYDSYGFSRCMRRDVNMENFRWRGLDGTVLNAHWYAMGYAGAFFPNGRRVVNAEELSFADFCKDQIGPLVEGLAAYCQDDPRILPSGGDMMYPSAAAPEIVRALSEDPEMPPIRFTTMEQAMDTIPWDAKPVFGGEFESSQQGTFTTNIRIKQENQRLTQRLIALETLAALRGEDVSFTLAWKLLLKQQFHDTICGTLCDEAVLECERDYAALSILLTETLARLSPEEETPAFFNPLPFDRRVSVEVEGTQKTISLPALGFAKLSEAAAPAPIEEAPTLPLAFETAWYRATVDKQGYVASLVETGSGLDLVGSAAACDGRPIPFGGLVMQVDNGDGWNHFETPPSFMREHGGYTYNMPDPYDRDGESYARKVGPHMPQITSARVAEATAESVTIEQTGVLRFWITQVRFTTRITLRKDSPRIEYHTEFPVESKHLRVRAAFPASLAKGAIRHQIPYGLVERGEEGFQAVQQFIDYSDGPGLALINRGLPGNSVEGGIMMVALFRSVAMEYKTQSELSYNLGEHLGFDYAILPHDRGQDALLWREAEDFNAPPLLTTLPDSHAAFQVEGAFLSALRPTAEGVFLRVYEYLGDGASARVRVPAGFTSYALTDGLEEPVSSALPVPAEGMIEIPLGPWKVQGVLVRSHASM